MSLRTSTGRTLSTQDGTVWLQRYAAFEAFIWGGRCMRVEEGSVSEGGVTVTTRQNPRGGIERDAVHEEPPGMAEGTLVMKRTMYDRNKTVLRSCYWNIDKRIHCAGMDRDAWNEWEEITRVCQAKFGDRSMSGTSWDEGEDALINMSYTGMDEVDIYRVSGSAKASIASKSIQILDVSVCMLDRCPNHCDAQEECVVVASTEDDSSNSYLLTNRYGGDFAQWQSVTLTAFGAQDANAVACAGYFVVVVSTGDTSIIVSDDLGATQVNIDQTEVSDWTANPPVCVDIYDQTFIVIGGENGYIYASYDAGRTWSTISAGEATTQNIDEIQICPTNAQVIYAATAAADVIIKSTNGGRTWFAVTATGLGGTGIESLCVIDENRVLVGSDQGELFYTDDGATTWTEQTDLPVTTKATAAIKDIVLCGCGVLYLIVSDTSESEFLIFRNVDGGADGKWYKIKDLETLADELLAADCCGPNNLIAVGGTAATSSHAVLIE